MKKKTKITATVNKKVNDVLEEYINDTKQFNKSKLIEELIKKQVEKDINDNKNIKI